MFFLPAQDERNKVVVAEVGGLAGGLCSFTSDVNLSFLFQAFETEEYDFFVQPDYHDQLKATWVRDAFPSDKFPGLCLPKPLFAKALLSFEAFFADG